MRGLPVGLMECEFQPVFPTPLCHHPALQGRLKARRHGRSQWWIGDASPFPSTRSHCCGSFGVLTWLFIPADPVSSAKPSQLSATSWVTVQTVYMQVCAAAVFAIQAPLLGPRVFGLVAIVWVFVTFCEEVMDTATETLISVQRLEHEHYGAMNALVLAFGVAVGLALVIGSRPIASWFAEPSLVNVIRVMAALPLLTGLGAAPNAATRRNVDFKPLALRTIAGVTCAGVTGVILAILGAGVWALVWQALVQRAVCLVVLWRGSPLAPRLSLSRAHFRDLSLFVWPLFLAKAMAWASAQLPRFILALHLAVADLGLYSMAARLADIAVMVTAVPRSAVARVALRRYAIDASGLDAAVRRFMQSMSLLTFPLCVGASVLMPTLVHAWLNPRWFGAILPAQALLLAAGTKVTFYGGNTLFLALGRQRNEALMSVLQTITMAITAWYFGASGLLAVTLALAARPVLLVPLEAWLVRKTCHVSASAFLGGQALPLGAATITGAVVWLLRDHTAATLGNLSALALLGAAFLTIYSCLLYLLARGELRQMLPGLHPHP